MIDNSTKKFLETNLKGLMMDTIERMEKETALLRKGGLYEASPSEVKLFSALRGRERSISEVARALGISRQAVHKTNRRLMELGVTELVEKSGNKRDKFIKITENGLLVQIEGAKHLKIVEDKISQKIGKKNLELFRSLLLKNLKEV